MSVAASTATGAASGAMTGFQVSGSPWGAAAGAALGGGIGFMQGKGRKKANDLLAGDQDPAQISLIQELDRRIGNAQTGANVAAEMAEINALEGGGLRALSRGGASGLRQYSLFQRMMGQRRNKLLAQGQAQENQLLGIKAGLIGDTAKRKMFLDMTRSSRSSAQSEQASQDLGKSGQSFLTELFKEETAEIPTGVPEGAVTPTASTAPVMGFGNQPIDPKNLFQRSMSGGMPQVGMDGGSFLEPSLMGPMAGGR